MWGFDANHGPEYSENNDPASPLFKRLSQARSMKSEFSHTDVDRKPSYVESIDSAVLLFSHT